MAVWPRALLRSWNSERLSLLPRGQPSALQERAPMGPELGQQLAVPVAKLATACGSGWRSLGDLWWDSKRLPRLPIGQPPALQAKAPMGLVVRL